jgi:hypothetical protein
MDTPDHILRDAGRHAYEQTSDYIRRIFDLHEHNADVMAVASSNAMQAAFFHFYIAARIACGPISAQEALNKWATAMGKELDHIEKAFDASEEYVRTYTPHPKGH